MKKSDPTVFDDNCFRGRLATSKCISLAARPCLEKKENESFFRRTQLLTTN